ncbi:nuclear transport factor 2 family protein [Sphingobium sp. ZW T5_29]|uniref:nuclear transport factor 2 family protein n=1 Tax=Sphingobium sp. ZW T5_29 TaxID=3378077 RepID=UPI003852C604
MSPADREAAADIYRLACLYARAMDRNEPELLNQVMTDDMLLQGPGMRIAGLNDQKKSPPLLREMFLMTQHLVHNQTLAFNGDEAVGETYCTATHIRRPDDKGQHVALTWAVRYQDRYVRHSDGWRIAARELIVDWTEEKPVKLGVSY